MRLPPFEDTYTPLDNQTVFWGNVPSTSRVAYLREIPSTDDLATDEYIKHIAIHDVDFDNTTMSLRSLINVCIHRICFSRMHWKFIDEMTSSSETGERDLRRGYNRGEVLIDKDQLEDECHLFQSDFTDVEFNTALDNMCSGDDAPLTLSVVS